MASNIFIITFKRMKKWKDAEIVIEDLMVNQKLANWRGYWRDEVMDWMILVLEKALLGCVF